MYDMPFCVTYRRSRPGPTGWTPPLSGWSTETCFWISLEENLLFSRRTAICLLLTIKPRKWYNEYDILVSYLT